MVNKKSIFSIAILSLITSGMATLANAQPSCPTINEVKEAVIELNTVMRQSEKMYFVLSAQPALNSSDLDWIVATQTNGNGFDAAFANGQNAVKSVMGAITPSPIEQSGMYICSYMSLNGMVMTVAQKPQQGNFNPLSINFDSLKFKN